MPIPLSVASVVVVVVFSRSHAEEEWRREAIHLKIALSNSRKDGGGGRPRVRGPSSVTLPTRRRVVRVRCSKLNHRLLTPLLSTLLRYSRDTTRPSLVQGRINQHFHTGALQPIVSHPTIHPSIHFALLLTVRCKKSLFPFFHCVYVCVCVCVLYARDNNLAIAAVGKKKKKKKSGVGDGDCNGMKLVYNKIPLAPSFGSVIY